MPLVASVDYPNKRIYLGADSVGVDVLPINIYKEMRARRRLNADQDRQFYPMITASGNEPAGPTNTPRFTNLAAGVRIVPFDTSHSLLIRGNLISTADGLAGRDLFDRAGLSVGVEVDVDYQPPQVEIITVSGGSTLTAQESQMLSDIWKILELDPADPITFTPSLISNLLGTINIVLSGDGVSTKTATRQP